MGQEILKLGSQKITDNLYQATITKTKRMRNLRSLKLYLLAFIHWTYLKATYRYYKLKGKDFSYSFYFKERWYSPIMWILYIVGFIKAIFTGGIMPFIESAFYGAIRPDKGEDYCYGNHGDFKPGTPPRKQKLILWVLIYTS